ncbi:amino acid carrier protein [Candidatus Dependentiae bacterium]|nr:amino acid carrier protein [Candidatus Dependentiae bacterium]
MEKALNITLTKLPIADIIQNVNDFLWGWPIIIFFIAAGAIATYQLKFLQFRYFFQSWKLLLKPGAMLSAHGQMTPFQAFIGALNTSVGNGSLAGMSVAVHLGGPGAAFWIFVIGFFSLIIRYCEVYLSNVYQGTVGKDAVLGGPMVYLRRVYGGSFLPYVYAVFCFAFALVGGNAMQCNSIRLGVEKILNINAGWIALGLFLFVAYIMAGGAKRIVSFSEKIVPLKVGGFFISCIIILLFHINAILPALKLIVCGAFNCKAFSGALIGYSILSAIRYGISRPVNATEAGLGTAGILFGSTGSRQPVEDGIMSMVSTFISNYLVCFLLTLILIVTGVWNNGLTSTALTISAFETVFGTYAGWIVTILSIMFGMGVLVTNGFIARECWQFLTAGKYLNIFSSIYVLTALFGALAQVGVVWNAIDIVIAGLLAINLFAILSLMPKITADFKKYDAR